MKSADRWSSPSASWQDCSPTMWLAHRPPRRGAIPRRTKFGGSRWIRRFAWKCWTGADQARLSYCSDVI